LALIGLRLAVDGAGMIEVAGLTNGWHTLGIMLSMKHGKRLAQVRTSTKHYESMIDE
jgi:hypothetical protein